MRINDRQVYVLFESHSYALSGQRISLVSLFRASLMTFRPALTQNAGLVASLLCFFGTIQQCASIHQAKWFAHGIQGHVRLF